MAPTRLERLRTCRPKYSRQLDSVPNNSTNQETNHTIFFYNIPYNTPQEDVGNFVSQFGETSNIDSHVHVRGFCFVTYYDLRDSIKAIKETEGKMLNNRTIHASYALPQIQTRRDPKLTCSTITARSSTGQSTLSITEMTNVMSKFGDVRNCEPFHGGFVVQFFDLRAAAFAQADGLGQLSVGNEQFSLEYRFGEVTQMMI